MIVTLVASPFWLDEKKNYVSQQISLIDYFWGMKCLTLKSDLVEKNYVTRRMCSIYIEFVLVIDLDRDGKHRASIAPHAILRFLI